MTKHTEFWANGRDDFHDGVFVSDNPHAYGTAAYVEWQQGWLSAEADAAEAQDEAWDSYDYDDGRFDFYDYEPSPYDGTYSEC